MRHRSSATAAQATVPNKAVQMLTRSAVTMTAKRT
eukprot:CAMPEP_0198517254 /NCGR_PEP_ID=MMETSP1462-20131121/18421_1 /TAXON_ID=1333877 /ORGANISM="Brandtodinium nutriculum, Strain RCC3387" /LENGTH=34 /DNA_ID= /DNA_START= /DNA_END= /DNA_ORIENTATION=